MENAQVHTSRAGTVPARPLAGRVALITGASAGIGAAIARELARQGARVILVARRQVELDSIAREIAAEGGDARVVPADLTDLAAVASLPARAEASAGPVDLLVNNAGMGWSLPVAHMSADEMMRIMQLNLLAPMLLTRALLPGMLERRQAAIISIASVAGHIAVDPLYSGSKYGLRGFMLALRRQLAGTRVSVSVVSPGFIRTGLTRGMRLPLPGPQVVARAVARLATHPRREVVVPRYYWLAIVLERLFPRMFDRALRPRRAPRSPKVAAR